MTTPCGSGSREIWGILGGMGPLASAEFLKSIYEQNADSGEQNAPIIILRSDPTVPDRTESLLNGTEHLLVQHLIEGVGQLLSNGATRIVVCCLTIHPLLPQLPGEWQEKVVSLVDLIYKAVLESSGRHLLICTSGTRRTELFERHASWPRARGRIVLPSESDQFRIHEMLYEIKRNRHRPEHLDFLDRLLEKYSVESYIAGCTEAHILVKRQRLANGNLRHSCIDPLTEVLSLISGRSSADAAVALSSI